MIKSITLAEVTQLCMMQLDAQRVVADAEAALSVKKERLRILKEESVPMAMAELELRVFTLATGEKVTIKDDVFASISEGNREAAYAWLEEHNFGGLIKTELALSFGKGDLEKAKALAEELLKQGFAPELDRSVNSQTLKAFLREQLRSAESDLPLELFGARPVWLASIK